MLFRIKHLPNLLIRFFTHDRFYVCEECHKVHRRNGKELRLEEPREHILAHPLWYGSVSRECFVQQQRRTRKLLRDALLKDLTEE